MNESLKYSIQQEIQLRFLTPDDLSEIKRLCADWFPIDYPDVWYEGITSDSRFYSLAATHNTRIVGMVVVEVKLRSRVNSEDAGMLSSALPSGSQMAYILSLGVIQEYRRLGIASLLLDNLLRYLTSPERQACKAVYLHVLCTNGDAITFYERRNFEQHSFLPYYYSIKNEPRDGYSYVLYINGGYPPWSVLDYLKLMGSAISKIKPCSLPQLLVRGMQGFVSRLRMVAGNPDTQQSFHAS